MKLPTSLAKYAILGAMAVFASALSLGAVQAATEAVPTATTSAYTADLLSPDDRPQEAMTTPFRQAVIGIINYLLTFLGLAAVAFIIYGGILMVTDGGDGKSLDKAKNIMIYAGVGIVLVLLSFAIVRVFVNVKTAVA